MAKVPVYITTTAIVFLGTVEVDNKEEFDEKAEKLWEDMDYEVPTLCHQCSDVELGNFDLLDEDIEWYLKKDK